MVTLIDNLDLSKEERSWYEKILQLPPMPTKVNEWIDLEKLKNEIGQNLGQDEIHVLVATGGVEVYPAEKKENIFVFESPNFSGSNHPTFKLNFKDYERITDNPAKHHENEIQRLQNYLSGFNGCKVKIIEGDTGNSGLSAARLCAIYQKINDQNPAEILIGAAPEEGAFSVIRIPSILISGKKFYRDDLRRILNLREIPYKIMVQCKDGYIRRASEILGVSKPEDVDKDVKKWTKIYEDDGVLSGDTLKTYSNWFRTLTLKKIERVKYVHEKTEHLKIK